MSISIRFFASLKEQMGTDRLQLDSNFEPCTVGGLRAYLCAHNPEFAAAAQHLGRLRAAVNLDMAEESTPIPPKAEVAFFPPVTGG